MRYLIPTVFVLFVAGCAPEIPYSGVGVGFENYTTYQSGRQETPPGSIELGVEISNEILATTVDDSAKPTENSAETTDNSPEPADNSTEEAAQLVPEEAEQLVPEEAAQLVPLDPFQLNRDNPLISDEQDFSAVSARETIESDAERRAAQQQAYQVIAPTTLPTRTSDNGASVVEFALATTNLVGQSIYQRSSLFAGNRFRRNCAKYPSSDIAQQAFLKTGGPRRDRQGLDPDGDGFACFWDPTPFRQAVRN